MNEVLEEIMIDSKPKVDLCKRAWHVFAESDEEFHDKLNQYLHEIRDPEGCDADVVDIQYAATEKGFSALIIYQDRE